MEGIDANPPSRAGNAAGWCVCVTLVACSVAWSFNLVSFLHAKEAVLALGVLLLGVLRSHKAPQLSTSALTPLWVFLLAGVFLGLVYPRAAVWSYVVEEGVRILALLLFATLAWPLLAEARWRCRVLDALALAGAVVSALALLQFAGWIDFLFPSFEHYDQRAYSVFGNQGLLAGFAAIALPAAMRGKSSLLGKALSAAAIITMLATIILTQTISAGVAAGAALVAYMFLNRKVAMRGLSIIFTAYWCLVWLGAVPTPFIAAMAEKDTGIASRIWFWNGTLPMIGEAPVFGVGLGNFQYESPRALGIALDTAEPALLFHNRLHTMHAHNDPLELIAETGLVGVAFLIWWGVRLFRMRRKVPPEPEDAAAWASLAALAVFSCFYFPFHSAPHALAGLLLVGCLVARELKERPGGFSIPFETLPFIFCICIIIFPSLLRAHAEDVHVRGGDAKSAYEAALRYAWPQPHTRESYGMALYDAGRYEEAYDQFTTALEGLDTGRIHLLLGDTASALGGEAAALRHYQDCLARWPFEARAFEAVYAASEGAAREKWHAHGLRWGLLGDTPTTPEP